MGDQQPTTKPLTGANTIPIAQLNPELENSSSTSIDGVVTITWPFSIVTKSIAFIVAEHDFRLRRERGQVRVEFHGAAAKAVEQLGLGGGDEIRLSLEGVAWEPPSTSTRLAGTPLDWQLRFDRRVKLDVKRAETGDASSLDVFAASDDEDEQPLELPQNVSPPSPPGFFQTPRVPPKRQVGDIFDGNDYASPAFVKRARVSYGSLFEDGMDLFGEEDGAKKKKSKRKSRFSMGHSGWRYTSRSPSPEPDDAAMSEDGSGSERGEQDRTEKTTDSTATNSDLANAARKPQSPKYTTSQGEDSASGRIRVFADIPSSPMEVAAPAQDQDHTEADAFIAPELSQQPSVIPATQDPPDSSHPMDFTQISSLPMEPVSQHNEIPLTDSLSSPHVVETVLGSATSLEFQGQVGQLPPSFTGSALFDDLSQIHVEPGSEHRNPNDQIGQADFAASQYAPVPTSTMDDWGYSDMAGAAASKNTNHNNNVVEIIDSSSPQREDMPEPSGHMLRGPELEENDGTDPSPPVEEYSLVESAAQQARAESVEGIDSEARREGGDIVGEDYDLRNYDSANQDDDDGSDEERSIHEDQMAVERGAIETVESDDEVEDEDPNGPESEVDEEEQVYDEGGSQPNSEFGDDDIDEEENEENEVPDGEDEDGGEDEEDEDQHEYDADGDEEDIYASHPPQRTIAAPSQPIMIDLLSDSDDEEDDARPPPSVPEDGISTTANSLVVHEDEVMEEEGAEVAADESEDEVDLVDAPEEGDEEDEEDEEEKEDVAEVEVEEDEQGESGSPVEEPAQPSSPAQFLSQIPSQSHSQTQHDVQTIEEPDEDEAEDEAEDAKDTIVQEAEEKRRQDGEAASEEEAASAGAEAVQEALPTSVDISFTQKLDEDAGLQPLEDTQPDTEMHDAQATTPATLQTSQIVSIASDVGQEELGPTAIDQMDIDKAENAPIQQTLDTQGTLNFDPAPQSSTAPKGDAEMNEALVTTSDTIEPVKQIPDEAKAKEAVEEPTDTGIDQKAISSKIPPLEDSSVPVQSPPTAAAADKAQLDPSSQPKQGDELVDTNTSTPPQVVSQNDKTKQPQRRSKRNKSISKLPSKETPAEPLPTLEVTHPPENKTPEQPSIIQSEKEAAAKGPTELEDEIDAEVQLMGEWELSQLIEDHDKSSDRSLAPSLLPKLNQPSSTPQQSEEAEHQEPLHFLRPRSRGKSQSSDMSPDPSRELARDSFAIPAPKQHPELQSSPLRIRPPRRRQRSPGTPDPSLNMRDTEALGRSPRVVRHTRSVSNSFHKSPTPDTQSQSQTQHPHSDDIKTPSVSGSFSEGANITTLKRELTKTLRDALPQARSLNALKSAVNKTINVTAVVANTPGEPTRSETGNKDYMLGLLLNDTTVTHSTVISTYIYHHRKASLPIVHQGDVILLRGFQGVSVKGRGFGLRTVEGSAWAVFEKDDAEMLPQIRGPPVELDDDEIVYAEGLRKWWGMLDDKALAKIDKAIDAAYEHGIGP